MYGIIRDVGQFCQEAGIIEISPHIHIEKEEISALKLPHNNSDVELWPLQDLMCLMLSGALKKSLLWNIVVSNLVRQQHADPDLPAALRMSHPSLQDIARNLKSLMLPLPSIPPEYTAMVDVLQESSEYLTNLSSDMFRKVIPNLMTLMFQHSQLSPGVSHLKEWLSWNKECVQIEGTDSGNKMDWIQTYSKREVCLISSKLITSFHILWKDDSISLSLFLLILSPFSLLQLFCKLC